MCTYKVVLYLMLAIQSYRLPVLCDPLVSPSYVKQAASNQPSTNERFRSTSSYDITPMEYVNDNEKYDSTRTKIINKIKSSAPITIQKDSTLIEKKTMGIERSPHYNSMVRENSNSGSNRKTKSTLNSDQDEKFLIDLRGFGTGREEYQVKQASLEPNVLITRNDTSTSYRSDLKRMRYHHILNDQIPIKGADSRLKGIFDKFSSGNIIGTVPSPSSVQYDTSSGDELNNESHGNRRIQRQHRPIPAMIYQFNKANPHSKPQRIHGPITKQRLSNPDPGFIHSLLGVFDQSQPVDTLNIHPIKPHEIIITPPRYIDGAKILPQGFTPTSPPNTRPSGAQLVKNTERNPNGFGESERVLETDVIGKKEHTVIIHDHFSSTVRPHTIPKIPYHHISDNYDNTREEEYPENHQIPSSTKSMVSTTKNLYYGISEPHESYKHPGRDTKYNPHSGKYAFEYHVADTYSANDFGHQEMRNEHLTHGKYHVRLPDGRLQKVSYQVDDQGYHANVSYDSNDQNYYI